MKEGAVRGAEEWQPPVSLRWNEEEGHRVAKALRASGESAEAFARRHGLRGTDQNLWSLSAARTESPSPEGDGFDGRLKSTKDLARR